MGESATTEHYGWVAEEAVEIVKAHAAYQERQLEPQELAVIEFLQTEELLCEDRRLAIDYRARQAAQFAIEKLQTENPDVYFTAMALRRATAKTRMPIAKF